MVHGTTAVVSVLDERLYVVDVNAGALSMSCPVICSETLPVHVSTSHSNSTYEISASWIHASVTVEFFCIVSTCRNPDTHVAMNYFC